jgi:hypothetical protein
MKNKIISNQLVKISYLEGVSKIFSINDSLILLIVCPQAPQALRALHHKITLRPFLDHKTD